MRVVKRRLRRLEPACRCGEVGLTLGRRDIGASKAYNRVMKVNLFVTCLADTFHPSAARAAAAVLERMGKEVTVPPNQTCCGQPLFNAGYRDEAAAVARRFLDTFGPTEGPIVVPSSSCAAMVRHHYPVLFQGDRERLRAAEAVAARTFEFSEFLVRHLRADPAVLGARFEGAVTFHRSCHFRKLGVEEEPIRLLRSVPGLRYLPLPDLDRCCGFGGVFSVHFPHLSRSLAEQKVRAIHDTGAERFVYADAGCAMNILGTARRMGLPLAGMHLAELLCEALGGGS